MSPAAAHPAATARRLRLGSVLVIVACATAAGGCPSRRAGVARDVLDTIVVDDTAPAGLPTPGELLRLRVPTPATRPATLTGPPAVVAFANGDVPAGDDDDVRALRCLHADATRDYDALLDACLGLAVARPADPRSVVAVSLLHRHRGSLSLPARQTTLSTLPALVPACAAARAASATPDASCAELALVVDEARRAIAASIGDRSALDAARPGGDIVTAVAEGPFLHADESFASSPWSARPLQRDARYRVLELEDDDGTLAPAQRGPSGWWRWTFRVQAERAARGLLALRVAAPCEVRLDGVAVVERPVGATAPEVERIGVAVEAGLHVVEVLARDTGRGVRVSAFADDGTPLLRPAAKQKWSRPAPSRVVDAGGVAASLALPADPSHGDRGDTTHLPTLLLRHAFARTGLGATVDDERVLARRLLDRFGWSPPALVAAAQTIEDDGLPDRVAASLAAPLWAAVLTRWPDHPVAAISAARAASEDRPDEALARYRALVAANPRYPIGRRDLIAALLERRVFDEAGVHAEALLALGETNENIDAAVPALQAIGQLPRAARLAEVRARRALDGSDWQRQLRAGDTAGARERLGRDVAGARSDEATRALVPWLDLVELVRPDEALVVLERAAREAPHNVEWLLRRARLLARLQGPAAGLRALQDVASADARALQLQEAWGGGSPTGRRLARGDDALAARRAAASAPFPGFATVFLIDDVERRFFDDGSCVMVRHWIAELRTKQALDTFGELRVGDDEQLVRLRVVKPDGSVVEPERNSGVSELSLPGLAPGDVVEWLSWGVDECARGGTFWESRSLARAVPAVERTYVLDVPRALTASRRVQILAENGAEPPTTTPVSLRADDDAVRTVFRAVSSAPLLDEPGAVDAIEFEPQAGIAIDVDDDHFRRRRARELFEPARVDPWLVDAAARIAGAGPPQQRLQRLFHFVANAIVDADAPADAVAALAVGRGRRQVLFHALARAAGLAPRALALHAPLLAERRIPHAGAFPLTVSVVTIDGVPHVAAVGGALVSLDALPPALAGAETLDLDDGRLGVLDDRHVDRSPTMLDVDLAVVGEDAASGALRGTVSLRLPTFVAGTVRPPLRELTESRLAQILEAALSDSLPGVRVTRVSTPGLAVQGRPLAIVLDVEVALDARSARLEHLFRHGATAAFGLAEPLGALVGVAERHRPLRVVPDAERLTLTLRLPPRGSFVEVPPDVALTAGPVALEQRAVVEDGVLRWERSLERRAARVAPPAWPEVRAALAPLLAQADARIAFVVAGADDR
jgi:hypothetical protein